METVQFYNDTLLIGTASDGTKVVAIKPICESIGVDHATQLKKIETDPKFSYRHTPTTGADGKQYSMFCIPIDQVTGWLFTINANKVKPESREALLRYQRECMVALNKHFMPEGVTPRTVAGILADRLSIAEDRLEAHDQQLYEMNHKINKALGFAKDVGSTFGRGLNACKKNSN